MCLSYIWDWYDLRCSTESLESPSSRDYRSPPPVPSPWTQTKTFWLSIHTTNQSWIEEVKSDQRRLVLPLWESLAGGVKHTAGSSVQKADFATQHLHQVTLSASTYLHLPRIVGVSCAILRTSKRWRYDMQLKSTMLLMLKKASKAWQWNILFSAALWSGPTHNAIACNLEVLLGQRGLVEVTVKVTGCSERRKSYIIKTSTCT